MPVPTSVEQILQKHNVAYGLIMPEPLLIEANNVVIDQPQITRAQLLQNDSGDKLLAITPAQSILKLDAIKDLTKGEYLPVVGKQLAQYTQSLGLQSLAAMPLLGNLTTLVDHQLLKYPQLLLDSGIAEQYIELNSDDFQKLLDSDNVTSGDIAVPLQKVNTLFPPDEDDALISQSVSTFTTRRIKERLEQTLELPPLPMIAQRIIQLKEDPNADLSDLCEVVELDASLAAQVVSWASSPYYSAPGTIKSIHDAIVRVLGFDMVMSLALGLSMGSVLELPSRKPSQYLPYWQQSVYVAASTEALISCMPRDIRPGYGYSYLSGLLHNFGYILIAEIFSEKFDSICQYLEANPTISAHQVEQHVIGVNRNLMASWLMDYWGMPTEVITALRHQSNPDYVGDNWQYPLLIFTAKKLLAEKNIYTNTGSSPLLDNTLERLQIKREDAHEAIDMILESQELLHQIASQIQNKS